MMSTIDFSPLFRSSIGFDRIFDLLENSSRLQPIDNWPPYDIVREGEDTYRITMAVAGFKPEELSVTYEPNLLVVRGTKSEKEDTEYLHHGMATRSFERRFELADFVEISDAAVENGLLVLSMKRELPEAMKPRRIAIGNASSASEPRQIEAKANPTN